MHFKHNEPHEFAGQEIQTDLRAVHPQLGDNMIHTAVVEDWWDRVSGQSWTTSDGNPAALMYALRIPFSEIPVDNEVLYVKINGFGHLIHDSEILR